MVRSRAASVPRLAVVVLVSSRNGIPHATSSPSTPDAPETGRDPTWRTPSISNSHPRTCANGDGVIVNTVRALPHGRRLGGPSGRPVVATAVRGRAHAGSAWCVRSIHLALTADQPVGAGILDTGGAFASDSRTRRRAAVVIRPTVAGTAAMAELTRRAVARARVGRRLALVRQADALRLATSGPTRRRGIVGAADEPVVTGALRPAVTGAPLAGAPLEVALVRSHAVTRSAGETGV